MKIEPHIFFLYFVQNCRMRPSMGFFFQVMLLIEVKFQEKVSVKKVTIPSGSEHINEISSFIQNWLQEENF